MSKLVADQFAETLAAAGVKKIYGIVGDTDLIPQAGFVLVLIAAARDNSEAVCRPIA